MSPERPERPERPEFPASRRTILLISLAGFFLLAVAASVLMGVWAAPPSASAIASMTAVPSPSATPSPTPEPTATPQPTPTPNPFDRGMLASRYTVLVIGEDSNSVRRARGHASRTDTLMVVSLSPRQKRVTMLSVPRDTVDVPMANGLLYAGKVNGIAHAFGYESLTDAIATLLAIEIDAYVKVDMDNFKQLVDEVKGVKVTNAYWLSDAHLHFSLPPGTVRLDGEAALDYTRTRVDSDYGRAARQQQVLLALVRKYVNPDTDWELDRLLPLLGSLETNIDLADLPTLMEMGRRSREANVTSMVLQPPRFSLFAGIEPGTARGWVMIPNLAEMRAYARSVMGD
jgi:LCP family protein required for cell wall assembly